ncbi:DUF1016 domain-containing protein, partial [Patescibacteria group bacterium]|nr:DUF1016 domain-containing protein [Patescibacteria group bacterium]
KYVYKVKKTGKMLKNFRRILKGKITELSNGVNFYLSAVDDLIAAESDGASIGIILCKSRDKVTVEYALKDTRKPIGVAAYRLTKSLPGKLKHGLPSVEELKDELRIS